MSLLDHPVASFAKSDLRKPEVAEKASSGPVEIRGTSTSKPLLLVSAEAVERERELRTAVDAFLRAVVELRRPDPSPVVLAEVGFAAAWPATDRETFLDAYAEALNATLRAEDLAPLGAFLATMSSPGRSSDRPDFDGRVSSKAHAALSARFGSS